jgi:Gas vesicle protein G
MFILDSLLVSGLRWVLDTVATAADAELTDDTALREELLAAEMRREMGEISDDEFADIEADLLARIREIKERREGGSGPIAFGQGDEGGASEFQVEATVSGDFHEPAPADSGTVIEGTLLKTPPRKRRRGTTR